MKIKSLSTAIAFLGTVMGATLPAQATTISKYMYIDPSTACQLSVPTIDTVVRPRATGYRNEGEAAKFVICGMAYFTVFTGSATSLTIQLTAFDGMTHNNVSCTAVNRYSDGSGAVFSTKSVNVDMLGDSIGWSPADLNDFLGFSSSVTCTLPAGVAITGVSMIYPDEVGA